VRAPHLARGWRERGMRLLSCSNEAVMLLERATEIKHQITSS